jgi:6,7-dimethyl-8-ribityllumazine synthase
MKKSAPTASPGFSFRKAPHVALIEARFYDAINDMLLAGALRALKESGCTHEIITVPGAMELPSALQFVARRKKGKKADAFVMLGCVIRGATTHYETVCAESARGVTDVALKLNLAVGNGIITVENEKQALERADLKRLDKGGGAVVAALGMLELKQKVGA